MYTNSVAKISLDYATEVVSMFGGTPNPKWADLSSRLVILFNGTIHPEYAGYDGETIKQADVILLGFPLDIDFGNMSQVRPFICAHDLRSVLKSRHTPLVECCRPCTRQIWTTTAPSHLQVGLVREQLGCRSAGAGWKACTRRQRTTADRLTVSRACSLLVQR